MAIDPPNSSGAHPAPGARIDQTGGNQAARQPGQVRSAGSSPAREGQDQDQDDQVQLSEEARAAAQTDGTTSASGLSQERLHEILKRLTSGYYDSPQVIDRIAGRVSDELGR